MFVSGKDRKSRFLIKINEDKKKMQELRSQFNDASGSIARTAEQL